MTEHPSKLTMIWQGLGFLWSLFAPKKYEPRTGEPTPMEAYLDEIDPEWRARYERQMEVVHKHIL